MTESSGATPSGSDPAAGATPGGQQTGSGARPEAGSTEGARPDTSLGDAGQAALTREREARRDAERQLAELRRRTTELEDAGKSETERTQARLQRAQLELEQSNKRIDELQADIAKRELDALKREVCSEAGLPAKVASRLQGTDLRSLKADARALAEDMQAGTPVGDLGTQRGGTAAGTRRGQDMNALIREAAGR